MAREPFLEAEGLDQELRVRLRPIEGCVSGAVQGLLKSANHARF